MEKPMRQHDQVQLPDPHHQLTLLKAYLQTGLVIWGGGVGCRREGTETMPTYVVSHASEEGGEVRKEFYTALDAVWELFRLCRGAVLTVSDPS